MDKKFIDAIARAIDRTIASEATPSPDLAKKLKIAVIEEMDAAFAYDDRHVRENEMHMDSD